MKQIIKIISFSAVVFLLTTSSVFSQNNNQTDSLELLKQYSLFSEYHKTKDYESALPYGWKVLEMDPKKFNKWNYFKMEDVLWYLHDSADVSQEMITNIEDTVLYFYDLAIENYPPEKAYFQSRKAFVAETWLDLPADTLIAMYEKAIKYDPELSSYYYDRLGKLYKSNMSGNNDYKSKAIDIYQFLSSREPDNTQWPSELEGLVENIDELVDITRKTWELDKENLAKAWKYASMAMKAQQYENAIEALEFLVDKAPETVNYWNQLETAYQRTDQLDNAAEAYKKLIELEPENQNHYLNLGIVYKDQGKLSAARTQYQKANNVADGWGQAVYYEGLLYEQAARNCTFDFTTKMVYQLAVDTYRKAINLDPSLTQARDRINALSGSVPSQEDYFFRGYKSGQTLPINGECFGWIGKSITVP